MKTAFIELKPGCDFVMKRDGWLASNMDGEIALVSMWDVFCWRLYGARQAWEARDRAAP